MTRKFKLIFADKVIYNKVTSELSFGITEAKSYLKEQHPDVKKIEYLKK